MSGSAPNPDGKAPEPDDAPDQAKVQKRRLSWVWLIPLASLAVGGWLLWKTLSDKGPMVDVTFDTAEGLQAGQSQVKYKDIEMGTVESFDLTPDRKVVMHLRMNAKAKPLLTEGAEFWVVKPRVYAGEITGLTTVVSGPFMDMAPGGKGKPARRTFTGHEQPPLDLDQPGRQFRLVMPDLGALAVGSPLFFHNLEVGRVLDVKLSDTAEHVTLGIFVKAPYDKWVHDDTIFWNTSGVSVRLEGGDVKLQVDSFKAVILGGITFDTPDKEHGLASAAGHQFTLYQNRLIAETRTARNKATLVTYLDSSVDGLKEGSVVNLMGIRVGAVDAVELQFNSDTDRSRVRVQFTVDVDRAAEIGSQSGPPTIESWRMAVKNGLRSRLKGGNLVTGQTMLAIEIKPDAPPAETKMEGSMLVIPSDGSGSGSLDELSATAQQLLAEIKSVPFQQIGQSLNGAVASIKSLVGGPEARRALTRLNATLAAAEGTIRNLDAGAKPVLRRLPAISADLEATLSQVKGLAGSLSAGSAGDSKTGRDLDRLLIQVSDAAQSLRMLADLLTRHPEALIRGRTGRTPE